MHLYDKILTSLRWAALAKVATQTFSWAGLIYTVRQLDSHAFGAFGLATIIVSYVAMLYEGGMLEALIQHPPQTKQERRAVFTVMTFSGVVLAGIVAGVAAPLGRLFADEAMSAVLGLLSVTVILTALSTLPLAEIMRRMDFSQLALVSSIQAMLATATTVVLAYRGAGVWSLAWGAIVGAITKALLLNGGGRALEWPTRRISVARRYLRFTGVLILDNVMFRWYTTVDTLLLGRWGGTGIVGYYTLAQDVANLPLEKTATVVNDVSLPAYAQLQDDRPRAAHLMLEIVRTHATIGFPLFWGLAAVAGAAIPVLFGDHWSAAVVPLAALAFVAPLRLVGSIETPLLTGLGRPDVLLKSKLVLVPCMTVALAIGCKWGGLLGVSLVWVTVFPACYLLCFRWVLAQIDISFTPVLRAMRGPCLAAAIMAACVLTCDAVLQRVHAAVGIRLVVEVVLGVASFTMLLWRLDRSAFELIRTRIQRGLRWSPTAQVALD